MRLRPRPYGGSIALFRVGITGGISEGKSTVLRYLREAGYLVASADDVARKVSAEPAVRAEISRLAGLHGDFTPAELRHRLMSDVGLRRALNAALHPLIIAGLRATSADFVEVPLLVETAIQASFDEIWVVTCGPAEQLTRLNLRTGDEAVSKQLLALQLPTESKLPFADIVIRTNASRRRVKAYTLDSASHTTKSWVAKRAK